MNQRTRKELATAKWERSATRALPAKKRPPTLFGRMKRTIEIVGDIVASTGERWQADKR